MKRDGEENNLTAVDDTGETKVSARWELDQYGNVNQQTRGKLSQHPHIHNVSERAHISLVGQTFWDELLVEMVNIHLYHPLSSSHRVPRIRAIQTNEVITRRSPCFQSQWCSRFSCRIRLYNPLASWLEPSLILFRRAAAMHFLRSWE